MPFSPRTIVVAFAAITIAVVGASSAAAALARTAEPANVGFHGVGPGGFKLEGKTADVEVKEDDKTITITVPLNNLTTGIAVRDRHMKEKYLEVEKFPSTQLVVSKDALKIGAGAGDFSGDAKGSMTLHGKTKDVPFKYKASCNAAGVCNATGSFGLNMNDFGIVIPVYLGVTMKPDVTIDIAFQAKR